MEGTINLRLYLKMSEFFQQSISKLTYNWVFKSIDYKFHKKTQKNLFCGPEKHWKYNIDLKYFWNKIFKALTIISETLAFQKWVQNFCISYSHEVIEVFSFRTFYFLSISVYIAPSSGRSDKGQRLLIKYDMFNIFFWKNFFFWKCSFILSIFLVFKLYN